MTPGPLAPERTPFPSPEAKPPAKPMDNLAARDGCNGAYAGFLKFTEGVTKRLKEMGFPDRVREAQKILGRMKGDKNKADKALGLQTEDLPRFSPESNPPLEELLKYNPNDPEELKALLSQFPQFGIAGVDEGALTPLGRVMSQVVPDIRSYGLSDQPAIESIYQALAKEELKKAEDKRIPPEKLREEATREAKIQIIAATADRLARGKAFDKDHPEDSRYPHIKKEARAAGELIGQSLDIDPAMPVKQNQGELGKLVREEMAVEKAFTYLEAMGPNVHKAILDYCESLSVPFPEITPKVIDSFFDKEGIRRGEVTPEETGTIFLWIGIGRKADSYNNQVDGLKAKGFDVVCVDWPAYGSDYKGQKFTFDQHPEFMEQVMRDHGVKPSDPVSHIGHSRGAIGLVEWLAKYGDKYDTRCAIVSSAPIGTGPKGANPLLYGLVNGINKLPPDRVHDGLEKLANKAKKIPNLASLASGPGLEFILKNNTRELMECYLGHLNKDWRELVRRISRMKVAKHVIYTKGAEDKILELAGYTAPDNVLELPLTGHELLQTEQILRLVGSAVHGKQPGVESRTPAENRLAA